MKPSLHFVDLNTIICIIGRVYDQGCWSLVNKSKPTAYVEMVTPSLSSQSPDVTNFSTSNELDSELVSSSETLLMLISSSNNSSLIILDTSSTESSG